jgi:NAD(P)-dependent dehydrogenase (short-subunit alcohol dehydrogenase family)
MSELPGTTTVIVGASRALGRGIARAFAEASAPVVAVARAGPDLAELATASANSRPEVADAAGATVAWNLLAHYEPGVLILVVGANPAMRPMQYEAWETFSVNWHTDVKIAFTGLPEPLPPASTLVMAAVAEGIQALRAGETGPVPPVRAESAAEVAGNLFRREGEYWTVRYEGSVGRLKDAKGLRYLARLLGDPGREFHAVDLAAAGSPAARPAPGVRGGAGPGELRVRPDLGDAGELLDARAKAAYQARLDELAGELEEAERFHDAGRAATAGAERDFLVGELARAVGLGGRDRRAASHAERARLNVTRAIRAAMANLARANPPLGRHLAATIRTGRYCSYTPDPRVPITWER